MTSPRSGDVRIGGLYEGPAVSWDPDPERLRRALRLAGAPADVLVLEREGGRRLLEPGTGTWTQAEFVGDPGEVLALALRSLLEESLGEPPCDWTCTLRTVVYRPESRRETLLQVDREGVRTLAQELPWTPSPASSFRGRILRQWRILVPVLVAMALLAFLGRDRVLRPLRRFGGPFGLEFPSGPQADPGDFRPWVELETELDSDGQLVCRIRPLATFPDQREFDHLDREASPGRRSALAALRDGRAILLLISRREGRVRTRAVDLAPLRSGEEIQIRLGESELPPELVTVRLVAS